MQAVIQYLTAQPGLEINEAAQLLGLHPKSVYNKAPEGKILSSTIGAAVRFGRAELATFLGQSTPQTEV